MCGDKAEDRTHNKAECGTAQVDKVGGERAECADLGGNCRRFPG